FARGIAKHQQRERLLQQMQQAAPDFTDDEPLPKWSPEVHYQMAQSKKNYTDITRFVSANKNDPAVRDFVRRMKNHILGRLLGDISDNGEGKEFTVAQRNRLIIIKNRLYKHKLLRVNYTTYDLRRMQDSVNPRTHPDIMVLSHEDEDNPHPYWYARIIGIFHVEIQYNGPELNDRSLKRIDLLWVRWFARDWHFKSGWASRRLPRVGFYPEDDLDNAFGFVDPNDVVRAIHIIPAFHFGRTSSLLGTSIARQEIEKDEDWDWYYINM
ncbi:hypothetical protein M404DRAFT_137519, partial [Pisolithus tinctorius Marx 270]